MVMESGGIGESQQFEHFVSPGHTESQISALPSPLLRMHRLTALSQGGMRSSHMSEPNALEQTAGIHSQARAISGGVTTT